MGTRKAPFCTTFKFPFARVLTRHFSISFVVVVVIITCIFFFKKKFTLPYTENSGNCANKVVFGISAACRLAVHLLPLHQVSAALLVMIPALISTLENTIKMTFSRHRHWPVFSFFFFLLSFFLTPVHFSHPSALSFFIQNTFMCSYMHTLASVSLSYYTPSRYTDTYLPAQEVTTLTHSRALKKTTVCSWSLLSVR
uniref:Uncharacterized protein n=1 Tax=Trypanosoma vivax (strain Y486) TaxID=1055687 RepID=G0U572_TRYVY|nr:hypothetical protein TVY486_1000740 [Trypanosoma vivax Y486]